MIISYSLSVIHYQLFIISYSLSVIPYPLTIKTEHRYLKLKTAQVLHQNSF